jgi:very-short-patch-repair endonuclease
MENAVKDYVAGESSQVVARRYHTEEKRLTNLLKARGLFRSKAERYRLTTTKASAVTRAKLGLPDEDVARRYEAGESEWALSVAYGVSRSAIRARLRLHGVDIRGIAESERLRGQRMTPEQRARFAELAHANLAGLKQTFESKCRRAQTRERKLLGTSPAELQLAEWLTERGWDATPQKAIGPYNVDLALDTVAVEILGGSWHMGKARHATRTPYILNAGWHLVFIWVDGRRFVLETAAADYVVALAQEARRNPAAIREYRVIRGDGREVTRGSADADDFSTVLARRGCNGNGTSD